MTEIVSAAISAAVALLVALLAHRRAVKIQRSEQYAKDETNTNDRIRIITEAYEGLLTQLRGEVERLAEIRLIERDRWEMREKVLLDKIAVLEHDLENEKGERVRLQNRLDRLEADFRSMKDPQ